MNKFLNLLQFLTRITVSKNLKYNEDMGSAMVYFPVVGMVIGMLLTIEYYILNKFFGMEIMSVFIALVVVISEAVITGGLHIDGFGDTFDGLFSYRSKERILEIMKDPTMGTNGILAILFLIISKIVCLNIAVKYNMYWLIFSMPVAGRLTPVIMSYKAVSARKNGMGELFIGKCSTNNLIGAAVIAVVTVYVTSYLAYTDFMKSLIYLTGIVFIALFAIMFRKSVYRQIDGITGDILGCATEMGELIFLVASIIILIKL